MRWHYTIGDYMPLIVNDGFLTPSTPVPHLEKPILFFTECDSYEPTAWKSVMENAVVREMTIEEMGKRFGGLFRIGVADSYPLKPWLKVCRLAHVKDAVRKSMERIAFEKGSDPYKFWGTLSPVPMRDWAVIEKYEDARWIQVLPPEEVAA